MPWHRVIIPSTLILIGAVEAGAAVALGAPAAWLLGVMAVFALIVGVLGLYRGGRVVAATRRGEVLSYPPPQWLRRGGQPVDENGQTTLTQRRRWSLGIIVVAVLAAGAVIAWMTLKQDSVKLPATRVAVMLSDKHLDGDVAFRCVRDNGDISVEHLVADIDFICYPKEARRGLFYGYVVDVTDGRIADYQGFGI